MMVMKGFDKMKETSRTFDERVLEYATYISDVEDAKESLFKIVEINKDVADFFVHNLLTACIYMVLHEKDYRTFVIAMSEFMQDIVDGMDFKKAVN